MRHGAGLRPWTTRLFGLLLATSYRLSRHAVAGVRMDVLAVCAGLITSAAVWHLSETAWGPGLLAFSLAGLVLLLVARRLGYLFFRPETDALSQMRPAVPPDTELSVRASGWFFVGDQDRYLVEQPCVLTTPKSREHIVMTQLQRSRWLLFGQSRPSDWGWWYQFFKPEAIEQVRPGVLVHGWCPRRALKVVYRLEGKQDERVETLLSFDAEETRDLAWADLTQELSGPAATPERAGSSRTCGPAPGESAAGVPRPSPNPNPRHPTPAAKSSPAR